MRESCQPTTYTLPEGAILLAPPQTKEEQSKRAASSAITFDFVPTYFLDCRNKIFQNTACSEALRSWYRKVGKKQSTGQSGFALLA